MDSNERQDLTNAVYLSIVFPAYDEEKRIGKTLGKTISYLSPCYYPYEIIVVDDGSSDRTPDIVEEFSKGNNQVRLLVNKMNRGKGFSVKKGMLASSGQYVLFSDADLSTPIEEVEKLIEWLEKKHDIAIGSRGLKESDIRIHQPWYREMMGKIFNILVRSLTVRDVKDTQCGFKCFTRNAGLEICKRQRMERFSFDVEILYIAKKLGYKVKEVPIRWLNEPETKVNVIKDSANMFFDLFRIRLNDITGKYDYKRK